MDEFAVPMLPRQPDIEAGTTPPLEMPSGQAPVRSFTESNSSESNCCLICTVECKKMYQIPCQHYYCYSCITRWLQHNPTCPVCREPATPQQIRALGAKSRCQCNCGNCELWWIKPVCMCICFVILGTLLGLVLWPP